VGLVALRAAFVASARRARRSFFFCWPLRRVIFSELRLSNRPILVSVFLGRGYRRRFRTTEMAGPRIQRFSGWGKLYGIGGGAKAVFVLVPGGRAVSGGAATGRSRTASATRRVVRFGAEAPNNNKIEGRGPKTTGTVPIKGPRDAECRYPLEASSRARSRSRTSSR